MWRGKHIQTDKGYIYDGILKVSQIAQVVVTSSLLKKKKKSWKKIFSGGGRGGNRWKGEMKFSRKANKFLKHFFFPTMTFLRKAMNKRTSLLANEN